MCNKEGWVMDFKLLWQYDDTSTLYTMFRVLYSPLYQAAMQAYLLSTIEEKSWAQMNKNTLFLV